MIRRVDADEPMPPAARAAAEIDSITPIIGLEIHVELRTRSKMFTSAPSPAHPDFADAAPNTLADAVVMALPGTLPVVNREAVELAMRVGLALRCRIADVTKWDRKSYAYPDLPKGYQVSQYDLPLCFDGRVDLPAIDDGGEPDWTKPGRPIGIMRAHLEEDAGKLLHEAPGGAAIPASAGGSIVDLNRAGTPLLEIVTQPDFRSPAEVVAFCRLLRQTCRFVGATEGVMQQGHMRFEPNVNVELRLRGGRLVRTPIVEIKNLNSFRAVQGAIDHEIAVQPDRWRESGVEFAGGTKTTRGWDDVRGRTVPLREKEEAHDYRYFPDPDLPPLEIDPEWRRRVEDAMLEPPAERLRRLIGHGLKPAEAVAIVEERADAELFDGAVDLVRGDLGVETAIRQIANLMLQHGARLANERGDAAAGRRVRIADLGVDAEQLAGMARLRERDDISAANVGRLFERLADPDYAGRNPASVAEYEGWLAVRDTGQLEAWCDEVIADNPSIAAQIRDGKQQAVARLIGEVKKRSGGAADAKAVREMLIRKINAG